MATDPMAVTSPYRPITIPDTPLAGFVLRHAARLSEKPALIDGATGRSYTYGQLVHAVTQAATGLVARGFGKGDVLAMYAPNLPEYAIPFLAAAMVGGITTTINPLYTVDELAFQLNDAGAKYLLTVPAFLEKAVAGRQKSRVEAVFVIGGDGAPPADPAIFAFETLLEARGDSPEVPINVYDDVVALPYSSGTTGLPKGVMLTHHNLVANLSQWGPIGMVTENDIAVGVLPFLHVYGLSVILAQTLAAGGTVVSLPRFDLAQLLRTIQDRRVSVGFFAPPILLAMAKQPLVDEYDLSSLRVILSAAAPLGKEVQEAVSKRVGCAVVQAWGLTETSPGATCSPLRADEQRAGSVGVCVPNTECKVVEIGTRRVLGPRQDGEVCVRGPQVMKGYLNNPVATAQILDRDGWLHTGDIGFFDEDGYLYIVDRLKELIKYKGMQVAPAELEAVLLTHPAVADAAVIPSADEEAGEVPKAFVAVRPQSAVSAEELMAYVAEHVAPHKRIRRLEFVDQVPRSASGKVLRRIMIEKERSAAR